MNTPENNNYDGLTFCEEPGFNGGTPRSEEQPTSNDSVFFNDTSKNTDSTSYDGLSLNTRESISSVDTPTSFSTTESTVSVPSSSYDSSYYGTSNSTSFSADTQQKPSGLSLKTADTSEASGSFTNASSTPAANTATPDAEPIKKEPEPAEFNPYADFDEPFVAPQKPSVSQSISQSNPTSYAIPEVEEETVTADMNFFYYYNNICPFEKKRNIIATSIALDLLIGARLLLNFFATVNGTSFTPAVISALILWGLTIGCHFFQNRVCAVFLIILSVFIFLGNWRFGLLFLFLTIQLFRRVNRVHEDFNHDRAKVRNA